MKARRLRADVRGSGELAGGVRAPVEKHQQHRDPRRIAQERCRICEGVSMRYFNVHGNVRNQLATIMPLVADRRTTSGAPMILALGMALLAAAGNYRSRVETINLPLSPGSGQHVALHCAEPEKSTDKGVLFIHGSSFPTMLAAGFEFKPGDSWMEFMARDGFLACGLDFLGFGASSRPQAMREPAA